MVGKIVEGKEESPYGEGTQSSSDLREAVLSSEKNDLKFAR
jgi:hypothetical protein